MFACCCADDGGKVIEVLPNEEVNREEAPVVQEAKKEEAAQDDKISSTACSFNATIKKTSSQEPLGLTLTREFNGSQLVIRAVVGRAVEEWNTSNPGKKVMPGDQIVEVNGTSGDADALIGAMKNSELLEFKLTRETSITVELKKEGPLGLKLNQDSLEVVGIMSGMIQDYNKTIKPTIEVYPGDKIVGANGKTGTPEEILGVIAATPEGEALTLAFERKTISA